MNCNKVIKWLPLYIEEDLEPRRQEAVRRHLQGCPECADELEAYRRALMKARSLLSEDREDWDQADWAAAVRRAVRDRFRETNRFSPWPYKGSLAWLTMTAAALLLGLLLVNPGAVSKISRLSADRIAEYRRQPLWEPEQTPFQDVVSMTFVSPDTGLKIVWFFNKNFDLEEIQ